MNLNKIRTAKDYSAYRVPNKLEGTKEETGRSI